MVAGAITLSNEKIGLTERHVSMNFGRNRGKRSANLVLKSSRLQNFGANFVGGIQRLFHLIRHAAQLKWQGWHSFIFLFPFNDQ